MTTLTVLSVLFGLLAIGAGVWWAVVICRIARAMSSGLSLKRGLLDQARASSISIIVPAHNEERTIGSCIASLRAQDVEELQIIVVADRCTDGTEDIVRSHAEEDERVLLVSNGTCPSTWAGKCHAARIGAEHATGSWLAFIDADTSSDPRLLHAAVSEAKRRETALLSLLTDLDCRHWFERSTQPVATMALLTIFPPDSVNRETRNRTFANGQFMLFDRAWYEGIGGHAAVKDDLLEDIAFARCVKDAGGRVNVLRADGLLTCSMYEDRASFRRGWMRIFLEATSRRPRELRKHARRQLIMGWGLPIVGIMAIIFGALTFGGLGGWAFWVGLGSLCIQAVALGWTYGIGRQPIWTILLFPLGTWDTYGIMHWAARALETGEAIQWGGRSYVLAAED